MTPEAVDGIVEDARRIAHERAGQPYAPPLAPGPSHQPVPALLPITVCVPDGTAHGEIKEVRVHECVCVRVRRP
jgi:hypothetical protein